MPEFLLRYKLPQGLYGSTDERDFVADMLNLADRIQKVVSPIFLGWDVCYEVREFGHTKGMPDLYVTAWVTDKNDAFAPHVKKAKAEILELMRSYTQKGQKVGCWFQRVKGEWDEAEGSLG